MSAWRASSVGWGLRGQPGGDLRRRPPPLQPDLHLVPQPPIPGAGELRGLQPPRPFPRRRLSPVRPTTCPAAIAGDLPTHRRGRAPQPPPAPPRPGPDPARSPPRSATDRYRSPSTPGAFPNTPPASMNHRRPVSRDTPTIHEARPTPAPTGSPHRTAPAHPATTPTDPPTTPPTSEGAVTTRRTRGPRGRVGTSVNRDLQSHPRCRLCQDRRQEERGTFVTGCRSAPASTYGP
jgi:hypothetical protein